MQGRHQGDRRQQRAASVREDGRECVGRLGLISPAVFVVSLHVSMCVCVQYGSLTLAEDTAVGHTVLTIKATDEDDPESGSSFIEFHISAGNDDDLFTVETDGKGVGHVVVAKVRVCQSVRLSAGFIKLWFEVIWSMYDLVLKI